MSHDIADCPECGKRDFVLKENGEWECLNCGKTHKMLKTALGKSETKVDAMSVLIAALVVALFILFAVVPQNGYGPLPRENATTAPFQ